MPASGRLRPARASKPSCSRPKFGRLDNAYQHALAGRRRRANRADISSRSPAHTAFSGVEIVRQLLAILKERLNYTYSTICGDETTCTLRLAG